MTLHFDRRGPRRPARSILSNTTGVIQGTTPPTSLIYFFMQITIKAISSSEIKNISLNPELNSSESFQSQAAISSHFFIFFHTPMGDICWARLPRQGQRRRETLACGGVSDMMTRDMMSPGSDMILPQSRG